MGEYKDKEYYDKIYLSSEKYKCNYNDSPYYDLWEECIKHIPDYSDILEVGCGVGQFYEMIINKKYINNYIGFDFSKIAIDMHPSKFAYVGDARNKNEYPSENHYNFIICKEVLEHLADDIDVIRKWKSNTSFLITVPCFNDPAHVRYFKNINEVRDRYTKHLNIKDIIICDKWFIILGNTL